MTSSQTNASPLRQRMIDDMRMRLSPKTQDTYLRIVGEVQTNVTHSAPVDNGSPFFTVPDS